MTDEVDFEFSIPEEVITQRAQALNEVDEFPFVDPEELFANDPEAMDILNEETEEGFIDRQFREFEESRLKRREQLGDVAQQTIGGLRDATVSTLKLANAVGSEVGGFLTTPLLAAAGFDSNQRQQLIEQKRLDADSIAEVIPEIEESQRTTLNIGRKIIQFAAPFAAVSKFNTALQGGRQLSAGGQAVSSMLAGVEADFIAFDEHEERLSELAKEAGFDSALTDWLADREGDSVFEARAKQALEGAGLGLMFDAVFKGAKYIKQGIEAKKIIPDEITKTTTAKKLIKSTSDDLDNFLRDGRRTKLNVGDLRTTKEEISMETQKALAKEFQFTEEELLAGKLKDTLKGSKIEAKAQAITNAQVKVFEQAEDATKSLIKRIDAGDATARSEFVNDVIPDIIKSHARAQEAISSAARAVGGRSQEDVVIKSNMMLDVLADASDEELDRFMMAMGELDARQLKDFIDNGFNDSASVFTKTSTLKEKVDMWFMNSILSGPQTLITDTVGSGLYLAYEKGINLPLSGAIGGLRGLVGGQVADKSTLREAGAFWNSMYNETMAGVRVMARSRPKSIGGKGIQELKTAVKNIQMDNTSRFGPRRKSEFLSPETIKNISNPMLRSTAKLLDFQGTFASNFMQTKDDIFKAAIFKSNVKSLAVRRATNEGLTGKAFDVRVNELIQSPVENVSANLNGFTNEGKRQMEEFIKANDAQLARDSLGIQREAILDARRTTFTMEASQFSQGINQAVDAIPGGRMIVPFITTIDNMTRIGFQDTTALAGAAFKKGAERDVAIARGTTAVGMMYMSYQWAAAGKLTGSAPENKRDRDALLQRGWREGTLLVGDERIEVKRMLGPMSFMIMGPAALAEVTRRNDSKVDADLQKDVSDYLAISAQVGAKTFMNQSWMYGLSSFFDAVDQDDPEKAKRALNNMASSFVAPNSIAFVAREINPDLQRANTLLETIQAKYGMSVRPKHDMFGDVISRDDYLSIFMPLKTTNIRELPEWKKRLFEEGAFPVSPSRRISIKTPSSTGVDFTISQGIQLSVEQHEELMGLIGEVKINGANVKDTIKDVVEDDVIWNKALVSAHRKPSDSVFTKRQIVNEIYNQYKEAAIEKLVEKHPDLQARALDQAVSDFTTPRISTMTKTISEVGRNIEPAKSILSE